MPNGFKKIAVIGVGGRTGTMFAFELKEAAEILGIGKKEEVNSVKSEKVFVQREGKIELFKEKVIDETEFPNQFHPDLLVLAVKNPVGPAVRYYYKKIKEKGLKPPTLILSQNGIEAGEEAISVLKEIFEKEEIDIIRLSLFNPVDKKISDDSLYILYSLPIRMAISKISGKKDLKEIFQIFRKANFEVTIIPQEEAKNMEYSKLLLNLIGMASAVKGLSAGEGFKNREILKEEIGAIREYLKVVKMSGGRFLNFPHYPVKIFALLFSLFPISLLSIFKNFLGELIEKGRKGKLKALDEIDYYNGAVVKLGEKLGFPTPINKKILKRAKS
jgi:2-dehydropantoate 2-reductase